MCVEFGGAGEDVLVERLHLRRSATALRGGVEVVEVAEQEAEGVAQLAVVVADALHEVLAGGDVFAEVDQATQRRTISPPRRFGDVDGIDAVAEGFREGAALLVERPAGGGDHLEGRAVAHADGAEQGGLEPAAVLVAAFGVEVGGEVQLGFDVEDGVPAGAGLEPDVEDVHLFAELCVAAGAGGVRRAGASAASWMYQASAPSFMKRSTMALLMALSLSGSSHLSQRKTAMGTPQMRWREMHQSGRVAIMLEMRSSPQAGSQVTRLISSRARWRKVVCVAFGGEHRGFHGDEPLLGGAEDDGVVAAPAVRVGVLEVGGG